MENFFKILGTFFGYPECCSSWFEDRFEGKLEFKLTADQLEMEEGAGFIPCPECATRIKSQGLTPADLIKDRIAQEPYPDWDDKAYAESIVYMAKRIPKIKTDWGFNQ